MPAKQKLLPLPCPICGKSNGTIQAGIFDQIRFRIGHYNPEQYKKSNKINLGSPKKDGFGTEGKIWHNFRINFLRVYDDLIENKIVSKNNILQKKTLSLSKNLEFYNLIKKRGWHALPSNPHNSRKNENVNKIRFNSIRYTTPFEKENKRIIDILLEYKFLFDKNKEKILNTMHHLTNNEIRFLFKAHKKINQLQNKSNITPIEIMNSINLLSYILSLLAGAYHTRVKDLHLSSKHIKRILNGRIRNLHPLYDPKNRDEAITMDFYGLSCPNCNSWRVDKEVYIGKQDLLYCWACNSNFKGKTISRCNYCQQPLDSRTLEIMKKNNSKCPKCEKKIKLTSNLN